MKKILYIITSLLFAVSAFGQVTQLEMNKMVSDSVKNTLADLNVQLSVTVLDSASLNSEAELETLTGVNFYKVGDDIPLADGGLGMTSGDKGSFIYFTAGNALGRFAWTTAGSYLVTGADSTWTTAQLLKDGVAGDGLGGGADDILLGTDSDVTFTVLVNAAGGIETTDDSLNIKLDGATLTLSATGIKVTDNTYQPLEATLTDIADGTIAEDLVNTANPWADNEVADNLTASNYLPLAGGTMTGSVTYNHNGSNSNSDTLIFLSNNGGEIDTQYVVACYGSDPYLRICGSDDAGNPVPVMDIKDQKIVFFNGAGGVDYAFEFNGESNDGTITYDEDNDEFDFDNNITAGGSKVVVMSDTSATIGTKWDDYGYGGFSVYEATTTLTIEAVDQYHAVSLTGISAGDLQGFSYTDGDTGLISAFVERGANLSCVSAGHGLTTGDIVTLVGADIEVGDANHYVGIYSVTVPHVDSFYVAHAYIGDATAVWHEGSYLKCSADAAGMYDATYFTTSYSTNASANNYKYEIYINATAVDEGVGEFTSSGTERHSCDGGWYFTLAQGDRVWLAVENKTDGDDIVPAQISLKLRRM